MKKILLLILLASIFAACGGDDDPVDEEAQKREWKGDKAGYNPVVGEWRVFTLNGGIRAEDSPLIYKFTTDRKWYISERISNATGEPIYDSAPTSYEINETQIKKNSVVHIYGLKDRELSIDSPGIVYFLIPFVKGGTGNPVPEE